MDYTSVKIETPDGYFSQKYSKAIRFRRVAQKKEI